MANIGYRTFNGTTDQVDVNIGNIASGSSLDCWIIAGRLLSQSADGEVVSTSTYDPIDLYFNFADQQLALGDGVDGTGSLQGLAWTAANGFVILAFRRVASTVLRMSKAIYSGSWGAFTHSNDTTTFGNRTYPGSGVLRIANPPALHVDLALIARTTSSSDADINTCTTDLASWVALPNLTNLWRFDALGGGSAVNDIKGTATQNALTGTTLTAAGFPLADAGDDALTTPPIHQYNVHRM